jgi:hypothetical protein
MRSNWTEISPNLWQARLLDGRWSMIRESGGWVALPPNGRSYPFPLAAGLFRFNELDKVLHAVSEASQHLVETLGRAELSKMRRRVCAAGKLGLKHQFTITSCGVNFDFRQAVDSDHWGILWEGHGNSGALSSYHPTALFNLIGTVFQPTRARSWPENLRAQFMTETKEAIAAADRASNLGVSRQKQVVSVDLMRATGRKKVKSVAQTGTIYLKKKLEVA